MIRYRTRDLTRLLPGTARTMRRMEKITGRSDDMIILRGVNVFPTQIEEQVLRVSGLSPHFEIELTRDGRLDEMTVRVEARGRRRRRRAGASAPHQERGRRFGARCPVRAGRAAALGGQGEARDRQAAERLTPPLLFVTYQNWRLRGRDDRT